MPDFHDLPTTTNDGEPLFVLHADYRDTEAPAIPVPASAISKLRVVEPGQFCEVEAWGIRGWIAYTDELREALRAAGFYDEDSN